jgi:hypothetical protein
MIENNDGHPGSQTTSSGSGRPKPRPVAHRKNNDNTTSARTDSHDMVTSKSTESSPLPQSKGKERAIISREYPPGTVRSVAHASPANGDRFQVFGEGDVSADQTAAGAHAELEPQIAKHTFDDNPGYTFSASETAAGAAPRYIAQTARASLKRPITLTGNFPLVHLCK